MPLDSFRPQTTLANWRQVACDVMEDRLALSAQPLAVVAEGISPVAPPALHLESPRPLVSPHQASGVSYAHSAFGFYGAGQTVAVIDSGVWHQHVALGGGFGPGYRVVGGWDFTGGGDPDPRDDGPAGFHGTHVAGIIGASDAARPGVAPQVDLVALRVFDDQGYGDWGWIESALDWVHLHRNSFENPITTVNLSLGADLNSSSPPDWAMLEDEFAQLRADGVFISVSAGNAFDSYRAPGLSYPASSPHVVPVSSVNEDGQLSSFSQRHERAIAAPGENIVSTVPDYLLGADGVHNDFAAASGTSMAAPYVAGASVLLREALWFSGDFSVTQDDLYNLMRDTADQIFDSATGAWYRRLNVQAALDRIMPADEYGSTPSQAHDLGLLSGATSWRGAIGRLDDLDYFTFTAASTGTARISATGGEWTASLVRQGGGGVWENGAFSFDVVAGQQYTLFLGADGGVARYSLTAEVDAQVVSWGAVEQQSIADQAVSPAQVYELQATRDGLLTVEAFFAGGEVPLTLRDAQGNLLGVSRSQDGAQRIDVIVAAGQIYRLHAGGESEHVSFRLTNLVSLADGQAAVHGTAGDDQFAFSAATRTASVNGVRYQFDADQASSFVFLGGGGDDVMEAAGGAGTDRATLRPGRFTMTGDGYTVRAEGLETIRLLGGAGADTATLYDSAGADRLVSRPGATSLRGAEFFLSARGFEKIVARSSGGADTAWLYGSAGADSFIARPETSLLRGDGYEHTVLGFRRVVALAEAEGGDTAQVYDSAGDDTLTVSPDHLDLSGEGYRIVAAGFSRTTSHAVAGGADRALLSGGAARDRFAGGPLSSTLVGAGYAHTASGFERLEVSGQGGVDSADLFDSRGVDRLTAQPGLVKLEGDGYSIVVRDFRNVLARSSAGGADQALLLGSAGDDLFASSVFWGRMTSGGCENTVSGFARTIARAGEGGVDRAVFYEVGQADLLYGRDNFALLYSQGFRGYVYDFEEVAAHARLGQAGRSDVSAVDYLFDRVGDWG